MFQHYRIINKLRVTFMVKIMKENDKENKRLYQVRVVT
jgi:hypothetical protein